MENQHRKITGYRELDATEIALMNEVKAMGVMIEQTLHNVKVHLNEQAENAVAAGADERTRLDAAGPARWVSIAQTDFQKALMSLTRAVAQPTFF